MVAAFAVATLLAKAFGAGWGTASTFGQMAFVAAVTGVILIDERQVPPRLGSTGGDRRRRRRSTSSRSSEG